VLEHVANIRKCHCRCMLLKLLPSTPDLHMVRNTAAGTCSQARDRTALVFQFYSNRADNKSFATGGIRIVDGRVRRRPLPVDAAAHHFSEEHLLRRLTSGRASSAATAVSGKARQDRQAAVRRCAA